MSYYNQLITTLDKKIKNRPDEESRALCFDFRDLANSFERGGAVALMRLNTLTDYGWTPKSHFDNRYTANSYIELYHPLTKSRIRLTGDGVLSFMNSPDTDSILPDQSRYFQSFVETIGPAPSKRGIPKLFTVSPRERKISRYFTSLGLYMTAIFVLLLEFS